MSVRPTAITITPNWTKKSLTVTGDAAVRETVALTVAGCSDDPAIIVKFSSENGRVDYARFPFSNTDEWEVSGDDLTGRLNLNTAGLVSAFAGYGPMDRVTVLVTVSSPTNPNLYAVGLFNLRNWVENDEDPVSYVGPLQADIAAVDGKVDALTAVVSGHGHTGASGEGAKISHADLNHIGTMTHVGLESALNTHTVAINDLTAAVATLGASVGSVATAANAAPVSPPETNLDNVSIETITESLSQIYTWITAFKGGLT